VTFRPPVAVLDANVLYPQFLRDVLLTLAEAELFRPRWTDQIQREWMRNVIADIPGLGETRVRRTRRLMEETFPDARVVGHGRHAKSIPGVHPKDRHVAAAAIQARASHIVTLNLRDFPVESLAPFGIAAVEPDRFVSSLIEDRPEFALHVLEAHRSGLKKPPLSPAAYRDLCVRLGLRETAERLPGS